MPPPRRKLPLRPCDTCGKEFQPIRSTAKYCSATCRGHEHLTKKKRIDIPRDMRYGILRRDHFRCQYCGDEPDKKQLRVDHIMPIEHGGKRTAFSNLITACNDCNAGKSDSIPDYDEFPINVLRICMPDHPKVLNASAD